MRKLMKLMTITAITAITTSQVVACQDNSRYKTFTTDIANTEKYQSAFFGFLGSADNDESVALYDIFDYLNTTTNQDSWATWTKKYQTEITAAGITNITLNAYQGSPHNPAPSDPIDAFWTDKSINWQKGIFNWVYSRAKAQDSNFHTPSSGSSSVVEIKPKKDSDNNDMFETLPIVFIVKNGKLITAGQNWLGKNSTRAEQIGAVEEFVLNNLVKYTD